ncbi:ANK_REP_REGION domain-containing protein, partial [Haematococcus lacustris]
CAVPPAPPRMVEEKEEDSQKACVICLSAPKTVGLLHGTSVHKCVCGECAKELVVGTTPCPMCRMIVEGVL